MLGILLFMVGLTEKQVLILDFVARFSKEQGYPPTIREIGAFFQIAAPSVLEHLRALEKKGFIRRVPFKPRCLEILKTGEDKAA